MWEEWPWKKSMDPTFLPSIIMDGEPLSQCHLPEQLLGREEQIQQLTQCLSSMQQCQSPIHVWVYGRPGAGKTATVQHVLRQLNQSGRMASVLVNCWERATFFEIADEIVTQLRILRAEEHRTSVKLEKLKKFIANQPLVVVLDEVDRIKPAERSAVLYNLASLGRLATVCISKTQDTLFELEERARSRLNFYSVHFEPYVAVQVWGILHDRAAASLAPGSWSSEAIERIVKAAAGDVRIAISLLRTAASLTPHDQIIDLSHLEQQWNAAAQAHKSQLLNRLTADHRLLYEIILQRMHVLSTDLWPAYLERCHRIGRRPIAMRTFSNYTNQLVQMELAACQQGRTKGKVREFCATA
jgi:archaeal cell division control protein 6